MTDPRAAKNAWQKRRSAERRAAGVCINSELHGQAVKGGRCLACWEVKLAWDRDHAGVKARPRLLIGDGPIPTIGRPWLRALEVRTNRLIRSIRRAAAELAQRDEAAA